MMHTADMLRAFAPYREDAIVVPGRGGRYWIDLTTRPNLDVPIGESSPRSKTRRSAGAAVGRPARATR
jgi:hypothetical protein